jgi:uncharacterized damage-inducible protein DinB
MNNLDFFKACFSYEIAGTVAAFKSLPTDKLDYRPHVKNKSAREQIGHILGHSTLFHDMINTSVFSEKDEMDFEDNHAAAKIFEERAIAILAELENYSLQKWDEEMVELQYDGKTVRNAHRYRLMWVFLFDIVHHRGQLSSYIRPMGGKNPAIYGSSADTVG